jgi:hypothetical protein
VLARRERANPRKTAERVLEELKLPPDLIAKTEIAGPGFINFWLAGSQRPFRLVGNGSCASYRVAVKKNRVALPPTDP